MTYCVGILVDDGLVMIADTRTNAGVDNIATYKKLHIFEKPGDRFIAIASAGNLGSSQTVISMITEGIENPETGHIETIWTQPSMFKTAQFVGRAIRDVYKTDGRSLEQQSAAFDVTFLVGGQIEGGRLRLFMVYAAGNFIEATDDTPYLQIGEHKYGKPILDRAVGFDTDLHDALKLGLVSMDSTMRSNLSVGMPLDLIIYRRDALKAELNHRVEVGDPYFHDLQDRWSSALQAAHKAIPRPPYGDD